MGRKAVGYRLLLYIGTQKDVGTVQEIKTLLGEKVSEREDPGVAGGPLWERRKIEHLTS